MDKLLYLIAAVVCLDLAFIAYSYSTGIDLAASNSVMPPSQTEPLKLQTDLPDVGEYIASVDGEDERLVNTAPSYDKIRVTRPIYLEREERQATTNGYLLFPTNTIVIGDPRNATRRESAPVASRVSGVSTVARSQEKTKNRSLIAKTGSVIKKPYDWLKAVARVFD